MKKLISLLAQNKKYVIFSLFFFLFALLWASNIPLMGDDWMWGSREGESLLSSWFEGYNGRFSGNLIILALTRSTALRVLFFASLLLFVMLAPCLLIKKKSLALMAFSSLSLLLIPKSVMVQGLVWISAFTNYVPPVAIMMLFFIVEREAFEETAPAHSHIRVGLCSLAFLLLGFVGAMFMETVTLCTILAVSLFIIRCYVKHKRIFPSHIAFLLGNMVGATVLFSNSVNDGYRIFPSAENVGRIIYSRITNIVTTLFSRGIFLFVIISALCLALCIKHFNSKIPFVKYASLASVGTNAICLAVFFIYNIEPRFTLFLGDYKARAYLLGFVAALYCLSVLSSVLIFVEDKSVKLKLLLCFICAGVLIAPMLIIDPYGPRCLLPSCLSICAFSVILLDYTLCTSPSLKSLKVGVCIASTAALCAIAIYILSIYSAIDRYSTKRDEYFFRQLEAGYTEITTCILPYETYMWHSRVDNDQWGEAYRIYNNYFENITFIPVGYGEFDIWAEEFDKTHSN